MARSRKGSTKSADEKRRLAAIHAKANNGDRRDHARHAAAARWAKEYDGYPHRSLSEIAKRQAERSKKARQRDAQSTSKSVIDPRGKRVELWFRDPVHHDLLGIDTEPVEDRKPTRPPRPANALPRHGDAKAKHEKTASKAPDARVPDGKPKPTPGKDEPPAKMPTATPKPRKTGSGSMDVVESKQTPMSVAPKTATPKKEAPREVSAPSKQARAVKHFDASAYERAERAKLLAKHTHNRAQPPAAPAATGLENRLRRLVLGAKPRTSKDTNLKEWSVDLGKGGMLMDEGQAMAIFDSNAPPISDKQAIELQKESGARVAVTIPWKEEVANTFTMNLGAYLKELDAPKNATWIPVGDHTYSPKRIKAISKAMPGPALFATTRGGLLIVRQGSRGVLLGKVFPSDKSEHGSLPLAERYALQIGANQRATS